ncbi:MAG: acyl-CoA dehydrogenase family protein [Nitrospinota bacterium]|nr:acyl-CoA dehydrogenase family protein [Nitrospinota bacterium]
MDLNTNPENEDLLEKAREISTSVLAPNADNHDANAEFPRENFRTLVETGFTKLTLPIEDGGRDLYSDPITYIMVFYELAKGCGSTAMTLHMHNSVMFSLMKLGTEEQILRYRKFAKSGKIFASHAAEITTNAQWNRDISTIISKRNNQFFLNGEKYFCTMAGEADFYVIWALLENSLNTSEGLRFAVVDSKKEGFSIAHRWDAYAMRATTSHSMKYQNVQLDEEDIVGKAGDVDRIDLVPKFGLGYSAIYLGIGAAALEWTTSYAKKRKLKPDNVPIASYPQVQRLLGEMNISHESAKLMIQRAAWKLEKFSTEEAFLAINEAKYAASKASAFITDKAIQVLGGPGLFKDYPIERFHRDARAGLVMPPNSDRALASIAEYYLKEG